MIDQINQAVSFIKERQKVNPSYGIILGTGLGALVDDLEIHFDIPYDEIPNFPISTVESHHGRLIFGRLAGKEVVVMQGRFHFYEGYSMKQVTFPVRVMKFLGIEKLFISNAAGGLNPEYQVSDLMVINDHINLLPENPLTGQNEAELGVRFPDMTYPYDQGLIDQALGIAQKHNIKTHEGIYVVVPGPNLETKAEYRYLRTIGADAVGMSTVPENIAARHMNLPCFAISVITDLGVPGKFKKVTIEEVIEAAGKAEPGMTRIIEELISRQN